MSTQQEGGEVEDGRQRFLYGRLVQCFPLGLSAVAGQGGGPNESHSQAKSSLSAKPFPLVGTRGLGQKEDANAKDPLFSDKGNSILGTKLGAGPVTL